MEKGYFPMGLILAFVLLFCTLTTVEALPAPNLSSPPDGSTTTDTTPTFSWSSVLGADGYRVQVDDSSLFSSPLINETTYSSYYTPTTPLSDGTYYWRVRAYVHDNVSYHSDWSSTQSFTISGSASPPPPSGGLALVILLTVWVIVGVVVSTIYVTRRKWIPTPLPEPAPPVPEQIEKAVYRHIKRHRGTLDVTKCAKRLGVPEEEVEKAARALVAKGKLEKEK